VLFIARAKLSQKNIHAWLPETRIWTLPLQLHE